MQITKIETLSSHYFSEEAASRGRSEGLHLSDILEDIQQTLEPRDYDSEGRDWDPYRKLGFIWERALKLASLKAAYERGDLIDPGELKVDGIWMSPDGLHLGDAALEEWKLTYKSSRRLEQHGLDGAFPRWFWQMKSYCHALGTRRANLRVFFVNGDYRWLKGGEESDKDMAWRIEFTEREIQDNWRMITRTAKNKGWI